MKNQLYPCLWFDGNAKQAANFYCSVFSDAKITTENDMVVLWEIGGFQMMGLNGGPMFTMNPSISIFVHCTSTEACKRIWEGLSEGATVLMPLEKYPWSEHYGWIQDQFGFTWQIMLSDRDMLMPAMLFTGAQLGRAHEALDFYTKLFPDSEIANKHLYPDESPFAGNVSYAEFSLNGKNMVAMDGPNDHNYSFSEGVSIVVNCENQEEIDFYWDHFTSNGGEESQCGWCKDRFGVSWQVIPKQLGQLVNDPDKGQKVVAAFLKMKKFDLEVLLNV